MPESTCLHIQDHESGPIRVVEIPWISVRIGRAAFCEVRLIADGLADEACRLYRRGRSWHLVPVAGEKKTEITLEGKSIGASCPLPFDRPFRIGNFWLTLRQDRAADPDWEMYPGAAPTRVRWSRPAFEEFAPGPKLAERADLIVEPRVTVEPALKPEWRPHEPAAGGTTGGEHATTARVKQQWETRWRAAGAEVKARAQRSPAPSEPRRPAVETGFDSVPLKEPRVPRTPPTARPRPEPPPTPAPPPPLMATPRPAVDVKVEIEAEVEVQVEVEVEVEPSWTIPEADVSPPVDVSPPIDASPPADSQQVGASSELAPHRDEDGPPASESLSHKSVDAGSGVGRIANPSHEFEHRHRGLPPCATDSGPSGTIAADPGTPAMAFEAGPDATPIDALTSEVTSRFVPEPKNRADDQTSYSRSRFDHGPRTVTAGRRALEDARGPAPLPSAKDILACHRPTVRRHVPGSALRQPRPDAGLTVAREPAHWSLPGWLAGPPAGALVMAVGIAAVILSSWWATDAYSVAVITTRLINADRRAQRGALPVSVAPPDGTWARSTAQHLAHWAIFMTLNDPGGEPSPRDVAALVDRALQICPINPTARLAAAQLEPPRTGAPISPRALGLSRDAISLSWTARRLLATGNKDDALKMFEKALKVTTLSEPARAGSPPFSGDPNVSRYLLPGEERVQNIVREIVANNAWTFGEWSAALPKTPVHLLAAARLLKEQGRSEAEGLLDLVLNDRQRLEGASSPSGLAVAARAEAFALKSQWRDAEEQYRLAIEQSDDETLKRSWWFNLADIELKLDDEIQRQTALRAALAVKAGDDIYRRASELQRGTSVRPFSRSLGTKAN
jgi:hypothetical protein